MNMLENIRKIMKESKFCYAKEGGAGYDSREKCVCTKENPCEAILDRDRFHKNFEGMNMDEIMTNRSKILKSIESEYEDSQWYRDNVDE